MSLDAVQGLFFALGACGSGVEALYYVRSLAGGLEFETDMRWFVEVSRVGENGVADEYCVEAKQWQAALQEARKLRGDTGALSKFSIELLDRGYRAVDPSLKLRYLINEAPPDAPLTGSGETSKKHGHKSDASSKPRAADSLAPSAYTTSLAPTPFTTSLAPPAGASPVPRPTSLAPRATSAVPPRVASVEPPRVAPVELPPAASVAPPPVASVAPPPVAPPPVAPPPVASVQPPPVAPPPVEPPPPLAPPPVVSVEPARPAQLVVPADPVPRAPRLPGALSEPPPPVPPFELVRQRAEEPRPESPITYREFAYAVEPGRTRAEVEALLRDRYQATLATIEDRPPGKFVQLAVFDHVFKRRPERPPLATFAWKDWRGDPVLAFPGFGDEPMAPVSRVPAAPASVPPSANGSAPASGSIAPPSTPVVPMAPVIIASVPPGPEKVVEAAPTPEAEPEIPIDDVPPAPPAELDIPIDEAAPTLEATVPINPPAPAALVEAPLPVVEASPAPHVEVTVPIVEGGRAPVVEEAAPTPSAAPAPAVESTASIVEGGRAPVLEVPVALVEGGRPPVVEAPLPAATAPASSFELTFEAPVHAPSPAPSNPKSADRASRPRIASEARRRAGEDLIGELFEIMHDLHFARDVAEGAEFVLSVLNELLPCEGVLVHVFDINTGHFVVVRAKGPHAASVLLQRMSDQDPLVRSVMRNTHAQSVRNATDDPRFAGPRWQALGVAPRAALCGGVQLSGRYLGLIEVANPHGDIPFHQSELNALDYICEQFAVFLSKKPIVLSADVVLSHS